MNADELPVSEDDLHASVDDRLPLDEQARIVRYLDGNPAVAARIAAWRDGRDLLRQALASKLREPIPPALDLRRLAEARAVRRWRPVTVAAAVALAMLAGGGVGWWTRGSDMPHGLAGLAQQAVLAQRVFAAGLEPVEFGEIGAVQRVGQGGPEPSRKVQAPDLTASGYTLLGGRMVATEQGTAILFLYRDATGKRVGLFVRLMIGIDTDAKTRKIAGPGMNGYAWSRDGLGYGLVSDGRQTELRPLADKIEDATRRVL